MILALETLIAAFINWFAAFFLIMPIIALLWRFGTFWIRGTNVDTNFADTHMRRFARADKLTRARRTISRFN